MTVEEAMEYVGMDVIKSINSARSGLGIYGAASILATEVERLREVISDVTKNLEYAQSCQQRSESEVERLRGELEQSRKAFEDSFINRLTRKQTIMMNIFEREGWYENRVDELESEVERLREVNTEIADELHKANSRQHAIGNMLAKAESEVDRRREDVAWAAQIHTDDLHMLSVATTRINSLAAEVERLRVELANAEFAAGVNHNEYEIQAAKVSDLESRLFRALIDTRLDAMTDRATKAETEVERLREQLKPRGVHSCDIPGCVSCGNPEEEL